MLSSRRDRVTSTTRTAFGGRNGHPTRRSASVSRASSMGRSPTLAPGEALHAGRCGPHRPAAGSAPGAAPHRWQRNQRILRFGAQRAGTVVRVPSIRRKKSSTRVLVPPARPPVASTHRRLGTARGRTLACRLRIGLSDDRATEPSSSSTPGTKPQLPLNCDACKCRQPVEGAFPPEVRIGWWGAA